MTSWPVSGLPGQVPSKVKARDAFQDTDLAGAFADATRYSESVHFGSNHAELMNMACTTAFVERLGTPIATTFKGKCAISDHHELGCGVLVRSSTPIASWFMNESDLLIVFGASFANHTGIAEYKPIIRSTSTRWHSVVSNRSRCRCLATVWSRLDRLRVPCRHGRTGRRQRPTADRWHFRRRWFRAVRQGNDDSGEVQHEHHRHPALGA